MSIVYGFTIVTIAILFLVHYYVLAKDKQKRVPNNQTWWQKYLPIITLLVIGFIFKSFCTTFTHGHHTDTVCFSSWSDMIYQSGIGQFYYLEGFTDYPPGYMFILYLLACFRNLFGIQSFGDFGIYLIKLVPMLCDLGTGYLIYHVGKKHFSENASLLLCAIYILNPVIVLNSSVWCQVDSVFTLTVLLTCYLCMEQKRIPAYFVFIIGVLIKPQTLIFTPILIFTIIEQVFLKDFNWKKFFKDLIGGLSAIVLMFLLAMPFGLEKVIAQYMDTLGSYPYASINAYNLWALLGQNWKPQMGLFLGIQYRQWGELAIVAAVVLGALIFFRLKEDKSKYFLSMAAIVCTMFAFSVRMHERYMYPAIILVLMGYVFSKKKELFYCYIGFTVTQLVNTAHVLYFNLEHETTGVEGKIINVTAFVLILMFVYFVYSCLHKEKEVAKEVVAEEEPGKIRLSKKRPSFKKADWILLLSIMFLYSAFAFYDLGSTKAPETSFDIQKDGTEIVLDLGANKDVGKIYSFLGSYENRKFQVEMGNTLETMEDKGQFIFGSVFNWESFNELPQTSCRYIRLTSLDTESVLKELVILDPVGGIIMPVNASEYKNLFDEQSCFEAADTFRSGTYFDEIYHARTAYEMVEGMYNYENTHPPLGKFFISLGVRAFGMNPFGWRVVGTLFGVFMLPFMYLFGKRMFDKTWVAAAITALFAFDFMHFTQTRIATIDVYGTFFIIAMYYFMYAYSQTSFHDTKLVKTWIPLGLSGLCMGLGMASKWTAVYAAAGLALVFFSILFIRYMEYCHAKKDLKGNTKGLSHQTIVDHFKGNVIKTLGACVLFFVLIPALIYYLSYIPFSDGTGDSVFTQLIRNQQTMFSYHSELVAEHPYSSWWYEWPLMIRPVFYYCNTLASGLKEGISSFGNPLVWWAGIPALFYMFYLIIRKKDRTALFITAAYFIQYVPWMLVPRITFTYHYFPSMVFAVLMLGYCMKDFVNNKPQRIKYVVGYVIAAFLLFLMFYPVIAGQPIDGHYVETSLRWEGLSLFGDWLVKLDWVFII